MALYSVGYGNRSWESFLRLLERHSCQFLIDVRSTPFSRFNPSFSRDSLTSLAADAGIRYVFMGDTLGGKPADADAFDADGKVDYIKLAESPQFQLGLARLKVAHKKGLIAFLMCSELKPEMCHRCKLVGAELSQAGIHMVHIDERGDEVGHAEAIRRLDGGQNDMFGVRQELTRSREPLNKPPMLAQSAVGSALD